MQQTGCSSKALEYVVRKLKLGQPFPSVHLTSFYPQWTFTRFKQKFSAAIINTAEAMPSSLCAAQRYQDETVIGV